MEPSRNEDPKIERNLFVCCLVGKCRSMIGQRECSNETPLPLRVGPEGEVFILPWSFDRAVHILRRTPPPKMLLNNSS